MTCHLEDLCLRPNRYPENRVAVPVFSKLWNFPGRGWALYPPPIRPILGDIPDPLNLHVSTSSSEQLGPSAALVLAGLYLCIGL